MKYLILSLMFLAAGTVFSQSKKEQIDILNHRIDSLAKVSSELHALNLEKIELLRTENSTLKKIMKGYVVLIDELNVKNLELEEENVELKEEISDLKDSVPEKDDQLVSPHDPSATFNSADMNPFGDGGIGHGRENVGFPSNSSTGISYGTGRKRLNQVQINDIQINEEATIYYKLTVDSNGNVLAFSNLKSKTTTTNMMLINKVGVLIKKQVKYNKVPGASLTYELYSIYVRVN